MPNRFSPLFDPCRSPWRLLAIALSLGLGLLWLGACGGVLQEEPVTVSDRPNVVLVLIDTFRPDHLGFYGYPQQTAPFLEGLMERSTVLERAYSSSSWTAPSTSSLFTSLYPTRHGVTEGFLAHRQRSEALDDLVGIKIKLNRLPADLPTLPEMMRQAGYSTYGVATNINIGSEIGFDRGFDRFKKMVDRSAGRVVEQLRGWKGEMTSSRPSFTYLHFNDVHEPYDPRQPWYEAKEDPLANTVAAYDSEIRYLDEQLATLYEEFGWGENTLLFVVSDHGEEFGEHGQVGHQFTLYNELMRVLMVVSGEDLDIPARRLQAQVSLIDVAPTILELVGAERPAERDGISFARLLDPERTAQELAGFDSRALFGHRLRHRVRAKLPEQHVWAAVRGSWKLIERPGGRELYNLDTDPAEKVNLLKQEPEIAQELGRELEQYQAQGFPPAIDQEEVELDRETLETLKSLGYIQ